MVEKKKDDKKEEKEKISEIFEIEKDGERKEIIKTAVETEKAPSAEQLKKEKKTFMTLMFVMLGLVLLFFSVLALMYYSKNFTYNGVSFYVDKEDMKGTTLYKTSLPVVIENGTKGTYNFYLRKDPRSLRDIQFDGNLTIKKNVVINMTNDFNCAGNGVIALANLVNLYNIMGASVIKDDNATCDSQGRYMFIRITNGNQTKIEQFGPSCYNIYISNCEILEGTEKFMIETFSQVKKAMNSN
jgi:hypothetical protein